MGFIFTITAALVLWIVLWATGAKAFDAFMLTAAIAITAAVVRMFIGYLPGKRPGRSSVNQLGYRE